MRKNLSLILLCSIFILALCNNINAATFDWRGGTSTSWSTGSNWVVGSTTQSSPPGVNDDVRIGVNATAFINAPIISDTRSCKSILFGTLSGFPILTITGTLTVTGNISQDHTNNNTKTIAVIRGSGTITCQNIIIGNSNVPVSGDVAIDSTAISANITQFNILGNVTLQSNVSSDGDVSYFPCFNHDGGTVTLNGSIITLNNANAASANYLAVNAGAPYRGRFNANHANNPNNLILNNIAPVKLPIATDQGIDFNYAGSTDGTVTYNSSSGSQKVFTGGDASFGTFSGNYQNLAFTGAGTKVVTGGALTVSGDMLTTGTTTPLVDFASNNPTVTITGSVLGSGGTITQGSGSITVNGTTFQNTGGTMTLGTGVLTFNGSTFTNTGTFTPGAGRINFSRSGAVSLTTTTPVVFQDVAFNNGNTKTLTSGNFQVGSTGVATLSGSTTLASGGNLTILSTAAGSGRIAVMPAGSSITGDVNVQRFFQGSSTSLSKRGYRLISSPVYAATVLTYKVFSLNYLLNTAYVSGAAGGGFNTPSGTNPTLYLYREDITPTTFAGFTTGNFKGVAKINNTNAYEIGTQKWLTKTNTADTTVTIPVGNGLFFFYRGDKTNNSTQSGTKVTLPFDYPEDGTFTQTGLLNQGTINVRLWHKTTTALAFTTVNSPSPGNADVKGFCLVGNPYASAINWEKFNRNSTVARSSIYGGGFPAAATSQSTIWVFNPTTKQYDTYIQKSGTIVSGDTTININPGIATGSASNMIASGQGFFIRATSASQTLSFRENAKTTAQPVASGTLQLMSLPVEFAANEPDPLLRLKLIKDSVSTDEVVLSFNKNTTPDFKAGEDAEDMGGTGALVSLSTLSPDSVKLAINKLPLPNIKKKVEVSLLATATASGIYKIALTELRDMPDYYEIWLTDKFTGDSLDMHNNTVYTFNINKDIPATLDQDRFNLIIKYNTKASISAAGFDGIKTNNGIKLTWNTEGTIKYSKFTLEKSNDGKHYESLTTVRPAKSNNYSFLDRDPDKGRNFYRLNAESENEEIWSKQLIIYYSDKKDMSLAGSNLSVFPNPVTDQVNTLITNENTQGTNYTINIINTAGAIIKSDKSSRPDWQYNTTNLIPGTYIINVVDNKTNQLAGKGKFIKK
ncbi:MAG: T9SS type A sorting domain-containing protein [Sphingobacteriales bacterium]|nr:MAG: T9SS type A sorting domain-containing protein [Sphingobacteriales bacterium]